jgi:hypothetical protein
MSVFRVRGSEGTPHLDREDVQSLSHSVKLPLLLHYITMLTQHVTRPCSERGIQSTTSHPIPLRPVLTLSSYLRLGLARSLFPLGFPIQICTHLHLLHARPICPFVQRPTLASHQAREQEADVPSGGLSHCILQIQPSSQAHKETATV